MTTFNGNYPGAPGTDTFVPSGTAANGGTVTPLFGGPDDTLSGMGHVSGGDGGDGLARFSNGGTGGRGATLSTGSLTNLGSIEGGRGGGAYHHSGDGGLGVYLNGGTLGNSNSISGGDGGDGLNGYAPGPTYEYGALGDGGDGGLGVHIASGSVGNSGMISGGDGGVAGSNDIGYDGLYGKEGGDGGVGVLLAAGSLHNTGGISGGAGGAGGDTDVDVFAGNGGNGGVGLHLTGGSASNSGTISGGAGGDGGSSAYGNFNGSDIGEGAYAGAGGIGVRFANGSLNNLGSILGGEGGTGGHSGFGPLGFNNFGGAGGDGGMGVALTGGNLGNADGASIRGGDGGAGGFGSINAGTYSGRGGLGGDGGTGVHVAGGSFGGNEGNIRGGDGGDGGSGGFTSGGGGNGGHGVHFTAGTNFSNSGGIAGGNGGNAGMEGDYANGGRAGDGVHFTASSTFSNSGSIGGGAGGAGAAGIGISGGDGGDGVHFAAGGTLTNSGTISGSEGGSGFFAGANGDAVYFGAGNSRLIVEGGAVFNGQVSATNAFFNVLELDSAGGPGSINGVGIQFTGFDQLVVNIGATWNLAGTSVIGANVVNNGTIKENDGDHLTINGSLGGNGKIVIDPTTVTINGAVSSGQTIEFDGPDNLLELGAPEDFDGHLLNFDADDLIDLTDTNFGDFSGSSFDNSSGLLTLVLGGITYTLDFDDPDGFAGLYFHLNADGDGSALLTFNADSSSAVPCYCPGTMILTDRGEVPVETLSIGDAVVTFEGEHKPVRWIGKRSYGGRFLTGQKHLLPIRIKAHALGENLPRRDLVVSPLHALYIDGVLIPAGELVNGHNVLQDNVDEVHYLHIELEEHDVIWAEGAAAETFVDDHSRMMFHNAHEYAELYPNEVRKPARYYAARLIDGYEVEAIRQRLAGRAGLLKQVDGARLHGNASQHIAA